MKTKLRIYISSSFFFSTEFVKMVFFLQKPLLSKLYTSNMSNSIIEKSRSELIQAVDNLRNLRDSSEASCENAFREEMNEAADNALLLVNTVMNSLLAAIEETKKKPKKKTKKTKNPRTARSFFAAELKTSLKEEGVESKIITATIASKWNELENKDTYLKMCKDDKERYDDELEASGQPPAEKPFRGVTLYNCFSKLRRPDVIEEGFKGKGATKKISSMWKEFKAVEDVKDTDEWKELEDLKKKIDDAKKKATKDEEEDEDVLCSSFATKKKKTKKKKKKKKVPVVESD